MKSLIFSGTFVFQMYLFKYFVSSSNISRYIDFTRNVPDEVRLHTNLSFSPFS
jgi:hypothetical protein